MGGFDFLLVTTCDVATPDRVSDLARLFASVDRECREHGLRVVHYVLLQRTTTLPDALAPHCGAHRIFVTTPGSMSLSRARNMVLDRVRRDRAFSDASIVAFPDDDAWYPPGTLGAVADLLRQRPDIDLFACRYGANPAPVEAPLASRISRSITRFIRTVSSNTVFLRSDIAESAGDFDERLGVGATIAGGEDLDFALRGVGLSGRKVAVSKEILVGHRDRLPWVYSTYYAGSLFAIARSTRGNPRLAPQLALKVVAGFVLAGMGRLPVRDLIAGLRTGMAGLVESGPHRSR